MVDAVTGVIGIEWIDGQNIRVLLGGSDEGDEDVDEGADEIQEAELPPVADPLLEYGVTKGMFKLLRVRFRPLINNSPHAFSLS